MTITLTREQENWLKARVATGEFESVEDAVRQYIDGLMAYDQDDLAWAKSHVDEARDAVARGEFVTLDEHKAHNAALLAALKG